MKENGRQVVGLPDVEFIIETLGQPEAFVDEIEGEGPQKSAKETRRFFRNPDEKVIGGVCSGIGAYFRYRSSLDSSTVFNLTLFHGYRVHHLCDSLGRHSRGQNDCSKTPNAR